MKSIWASGELRVLAAIAAVTFALATANVLGQAQDHAHDGAGNDAHDHSGETLAFRLKAWKTMHFEDPQKATQHADTVKKLGCELKQGSHAGHIDVSYRAGEWKPLAVKDHKLAEQWEGWLMAAGFDVSHSHTDPAFSQGPEAVEFRLVEWKNMHGTGSPEDAKLVDQLKKFGCDVKISNHGNHSDIAYRAPTWRDLHFADHGAAEQWMGWLKKNGFETRHEH